MSKPTPLQNQFSSGMRRDNPRSRMPPNTAWTLRDFVLEYGAPARERGGWVHQGAIPSTWAAGGIFAIFSPTTGADPQNLAVNENAQLVKIAPDGTVTVVGTVVVPDQNPVFHGGTAFSGGTTTYTGLVIIPDRSGASRPYIYNGTTARLMPATAPSARYATVYKDYTVLANGSVSSVYYPNRVWFSPPGDPDCAVSSPAVWDTTDSWIDFSLPARGLASTKNAMLVYGDGQIARVRGSIAPPDEDMVVDDPWQKVGLLDPLSLTVYQDTVYWCAPEGVYRSDGVYLDDITGKGGMLRHWLDLVSEATSTWTVATGVIRNKLIISVMDGTTFKDAFMIDLQTYSWTQLSNLDAVSFWDGLQGVADETFFARRNGLFVGRLGTMFEVGDAAYKNDGNGTAVASVLETPFYELGRPGLKTIKSLFAGYHLQDFASDNPTISVSYIDTPEATTYTSLGALSETSTYDRKRLPIGGRHWGVGFKFERAGAGDFLGYDLSAEVGFQEESKRKS